MFISEQQAVEKFGVSQDTLYRFRKSDRLKSGIHYERFGPRLLRYRELEVTHFFDNFSDPQAHELWLLKRAKVPAKR